jgi:hypothetical protein
MVTLLSDNEHDINEPGVEFFGVKLKVNNPHLAALLNSSVDENVIVLGRRTIELLARADADEGLEPLEGRTADVD